MSSVEGSVSSKSWHLTFNGVEKEVFIWKSGGRMRLQDGSSSGPVRATSFLEADVVNVSKKHALL